MNGFDGKGNGVMYVNLENAIEILGTCTTRTGAQIKIVIPIQIQLFFIYKNIYKIVLYTRYKITAGVSGTVHPYRYPFYRYMSCKLKYG